MSLMRIIVLTSFAMIAFAGNSLLCRLALVNTNIDAASFSTVRLISGALMLWALVSIRHNVSNGTGNWLSALALFTYAAGFSYAYINLSAATGALLLFGAVQVTMISYGLYNGERFSVLQIIGIAFAISGLIILFLPGLTAPPIRGSLLMLLAGVAWGVYSIRGKQGDDPIAVTAGNFIRTIPITLLLSVIMFKKISLDISGMWYAVCSGALASGIGYAIWYSVLPFLQATYAATVQLSVPVIAAFGGVAFLAEPVNLRLLLASVAVIGGIALVILQNRSRKIS